MVSTLVSLCFGSSRLGHTVKTNCIKLNPEICSIFDCPPHFVGDFTRKKFVIFCTDQITDQISLSDYSYFLRYLAIYALYLFIIQFVTS